MTRETVTFAESGVVDVKTGPFRRVEFQSDWLNVAEISLVRDPERLRPSRLVITLLSGEECQLADNATEADREWLASVCRVCAARFEG